MTTRLQRARLIVAAAVVTAAVALTAPISAAEASPVYNGRLVFMRLKPSGGPEVMTVNPDGSALTAIRPFGIFPTFAGENTIGFWDGESVSLMDADGSDVRPAFASSDLPMFLSVAPDAQHVAWASDPGLRPYVSNIDGTDGHYLSADEDEQVSLLNWSADGSEVIYATGLQIKVVKVDGSGSRVLYTSSTYSPHGAALSPDGTMFVFAQATSVDGEIRYRAYVGNTDGSGVHAIGPLDIGGAVFSPDGTKFAFEGPLDGERGIGVMNLDGSDARLITTDPQHDYVSWEPRSEPLPPTPTTTTTSTTTTTTTIPNATPKPIVTIGRVKDTFKILVSGGRSTDSDGTVASYKWQWGDNTAAVSSMAASHTYAAPGDYLVRLTVTDDDGSPATAKLWVRVQRHGEGVRTTYNGTPTTLPKTGTNLSPQPVMGIAWANYPMQLQTSGNRSVDPDGRIVSYAWDFGDGYTTGANPASRIYKWPATRKVTLTVTDDDGATASTDAWVRVD